MTNAIQTIVRTTDALSARLYLSMFRERNALMPFLFHSIFRDEKEIARKLVDPLQRTTIAQFRQFIEYYLDNGYVFVSPDDVLRGLAPDRRYAMITFDDGYFSNSLVLPILEEYEVPAVFFISANHVKQNKCFWWDVLYRERSIEGMSERQIYREAVSMKSMRTEEIEAELLSKFGKDALTPRADVDRPFTPDELRAFAASPVVHLGNHTVNHAILTNYDANEIRHQVKAGQDAIREMTGVSPVAIAYPNGGNSDEAIAICREEGLKMGFTVRPEKSPLPLGPDTNLMRIGRFCPHGEAPMLSQCRTYRSDVLLYGLFRDTYLRLVRGKVAQ